MDLEIQLRIIIQRQALPQLSTSDVLSCSVAENFKWPPEKGFNYRPVTYSSLNRLTMLNPADPVVDLK